MILQRSALVVVGAFMALITAQRVHVWGEERLLWMEAVAHSQESPRAWTNLGQHYATTGADAIAMTCFERALQFASMPIRQATDRTTRSSDLARLNLAVLTARQGRYDEALSLTALIQPRSTPSWVSFLERQWRSAQRTGPNDSF